MQSLLVPQNCRAGTTQPGVKGYMGAHGAAVGPCRREALSVKEGLCLGEFLVAASHGEWGQRRTGETAEFSAFSLKVQTRFQLLDIFYPGHFPLSTWSLCQPNKSHVPFPREPQGVPASPPIRRWAALDREAEASWGSRAASPLLHLLPPPAVLLFSLAQATGCDACFLLLMQTQGRGPKGMVGFA